jgi:hypothetical protein
MKSHLRNESFLRMFPALMKVAHDKGDSAEYIMAVVIGSALCHFSGEVPLPTIDSTGEAA